MMPGWTCVRDPDVALLLGRMDGEPVAVATMLRTGPSAHVAGVGVVESARRRGLGRR
jgi:hypothetical protein